MIELARLIIEATLKEVGVNNLIDIDTDSITIPRPFATFQSLGSTFERSGYKLNIVKEKEVIKTVLSKYIGRLSVTCNIVTKDEKELMAVADSFLKTLPKRTVDRYNTNVDIRATSGDYKLSPKAKQVGLRKIDVMPKYSCVIKIEFIYHVTTESETGYMKEFNITTKEK